MERRTFRVLLEWDADERVWVTHVPELDDLSTFGDTREEALANTREAIVGYFEALEKAGLRLPAANGQMEWVDLEVAVP